MVARTSVGLMPASVRSVEQTAPTSSAVRFASVVILHRARNSSPSKIPSTVCVFPMSTAINTVSQPSLVFPHVREILTRQKLPHGPAPGNIQPGVEIREPLEVERAPDPRVRQDQRPFTPNLPAEEQHVYVQGPRRPLPLPLAPQCRLHALTEPQHLQRRHAAADLDHAVEVIRLRLLDLDRLRLVHLGHVTDLQQRPAPQGLRRLPHVTEPVPEVAPEAEEGADHGRPCRSPLCLKRNNQTKGSVLPFFGSRKNLNFTCVIYERRPGPRRWRRSVRSGLAAW